MGGRDRLFGRRKDGTLVNVEVGISKRSENGKMLFTAVVRDITQRVQQEDKIARLSRIHSVLSGINSTIVRVRDRQELFNEACRIAVEHGNFGMAWIGLFDPAAQDVTPVAWAGLEASEYLGGVKSIIRDDIPQGRGVLAQAIKTRKPVFNNDITVDPSVGGKRRAEAIRRGYRSVVVLPLIVEGEVMGSLSLFAKELNFFDHEELKLLTELAGDVSFALEHIAAQEKLEKLSRVRAVSSGINAAIVRIREREGLLRETCRIASEEGKFEMIWIGMIDSEKQEVRPVAWTGFSAETAHAVSWASMSAAKGTLSEAIQTRKPSVRNNIEAELPAGKLRTEALQRGCLSTVCMPLEVEGRVMALIVLFATGRGFFDENELALLGEVASNISFALESIARQEKIERLSRIRAVLGAMNAAIVRIRSKQQLFDEACRIAHEHGKFAMSWVGMLDEATQAIRPVAKAGRDEGYLERLKLTIDPKITSNLALAVEAVARSAPVVCNDIATDGRMRPWRTAALERGYRSMVMLPLLLEQRAVGVFALYSPEPGFFDEEEMKLLVELAGDIAFALQTIEQQAKLDYLSYYDPLTGLPNRTLFNDRLEQHVSAARLESKTFAVAMLDLERFRNINETLGRQGGDDVIRQVGQRLKNALEETDILAHIGSNHFAIATRRGEDNVNIAHIIEHILKGAFEQPFLVSGNELRIAARAGVAVYPEDGADFEVLLRNAEAALKKAKVSGERYLFYQPKMNAAVAQNLLLENKLRQALEKEQFVLHYQPKVDLAKGTVIGLEALIRWNDPESGLVPPMRFIPLLEETGMILDAGRWAILKALEDHRNWRARGLNPPRIAVNVSPIQLRQKNFVNVVRDAIGESAAGSHGLDLEITESVIMEDIEGSIEKLRSVRDMGVTIAIDDFGTGYSSLGYLAKLPVNALKIDRSFIITMAKSADSMTIVSTIISMAHSLKLKVIAEGVESEDQRSLLRLLKCDEMQGYLFSRPLPAAEVEAKFLGAAAAT
jgi:diguanylate cyclase (GGDEF)-like protein